MFGQTYFLWKFWHKIFPLSIQFLLSLFGDFYLMKIFYYALMKAPGIRIGKIIIEVIHSHGIQSWSSVAVPKDAIY